MTTDTAAELSDPKADELETDDLAVEEVTEDDAEPAEQDQPRRRSISWTRVLTFGVLPALALILALGAGFLKWQDGAVRSAQAAGSESVRAAGESHRGDPVLPTGLCGHRIARGRGPAHR